MNANFNRSLKVKIILLVVWIAMYSVFILLVSTISRRPVMRARDASQQLDRIGNDLIRLDADRNAFLFHYQYEGNSLESLSDWYEGSARESLQKTGNEIDFLATLKRFRKDTSLAGLQASLTGNFSELSSSLNALFRTVRERGNTQAGLISQWLGSKDQMMLESQDNDEAADYFLTSISPLESGYLRKQSTRDLEEIASIAKETIDSPVTESSVVLQETLSDYLVLTQKLIDLNRRIQEDNDGGLMQQVEKAAEETWHDYNRLATALDEIATQSTMTAGIAGYAIITLIFLAGAFILIHISNRQVNEPLRKIIGTTERMSEGILPDKSLSIGVSNELEVLSRHLDQLAERLRDKYDFIKALNENNFTQTLNLTGEQDELGNELIGVRQKLIETAEEEARNKEENMRRRFINEGLAKFGEILRANNDNLIVLGDHFIRNMVNYLKAIQGGLFLLHDEDTEEPSLDLIAAFAYDRKKYFEKKIAVGEGLIGTCAIEKTTINLTEIPEGYMSITSGLGDTPPDNLLLVPVMHEKELIGVIEIASLKKFRDFEITFADEVAKSLAATILYTRNNERTNELLRKSQQQAVEMAEQEEEMRQNMEELKASQEESSRREEEYYGMVKAMESSLFVVEYDPQGFITRANEKLCTFLGKNLKEVTGKTHQQVFGTSFDPGSNFWEELEKKTFSTREETIDAGGKTEILKEHFASVTTENGTLKKFINFIFRT